MIPPPESLKDPIHVPQMRLLMGPGPSNVSTRVLQAQALPTLGHLHPEFCKVMDEVKAGIQYAFQTKNPLTLALSATGHAGMEAVMANLLEAGDTILIAENGIWGQRAEDMAKRKGAIVQKIVNPPGTPFSLKQIEEGLKASKPVLFFITHGESSTGVVQTLEGIGDLCANNGVLFAVDTVASLGGVPVETDKLGIDVIYTGSQKVLSCPPGTAPISFSEKAVAKIKSRKSPPHSFYLDMNWLGKYWNCYPGEGRVYHHTGPVNSMYALREALAILSEEGLIACYKRHQACTERLHDGLKAMGLELFVENPEARLPTVTTIKVPEGIDWKEATVFCMKNHNIEIAGGLGPTAGKVWRIGVMGTNATKENVERVLKALQDAIKNQKK